MQFLVLRQVFGESHGKSNDEVPALLWLPFVGLLGQRHPFVEHYFLAPRGNHFGARDREGAAVKGWHIHATIGERIG